MDNSLREKIFSNNLEIKKFENLINNNSQGYKFFWLEAIMKLIPTMGKNIKFEDIINEMIWNSWRTVTFYHLRLGHTVNGNAENFLEHAIRILYDNSKEELANKSPSRERLLLLIEKYNEKLMADKIHLTDYVPYRLIKPFVEEKEGKDYIDKKQYGRFIAYLNAFVEKEKRYFYNIIDAGAPLERYISINEIWYDFMMKNYTVIMGWLKYNKATYLQDRNPGVRGVMYKLSSEEEERRKSIDNVRKLWKMTVDITGRPLYEIYTGNSLDINKFDLDHFVPRSYICNDEIWNLTPMDKNLNSSKNNKLPPKSFIDEFVKYNYYLYSLIFDEENLANNTILKKQLEKCESNHLNAIWAVDKLYVPGNSEIQFENILKENIELVYNSALLQEYEIWEI